MYFNFNTQVYTPTALTYKQSTVLNKQVRVITIVGIYDIIYDDRIIIIDLNTKF